MITLPISIYIFLIAAIILLCIILVSLVISYLASIKRIDKLELEHDDLYRKTKIKQDQIIEEAQKKQEETLSSAQNKANQIIEDATHISSDTQTNLNNVISNISKKEEDLLTEKSDIFIKIYEDQAQKINNDSINMLKKVSEDISTHVNSHFEELKKILMEQTVQSRKVTEDEFKDQYKQLEVELAKYKKEKMGEVDDNIYKILLNVSKIAFGRGLALSDQEELVTEALEKAKKEIYI